MPCVPDAFGCPPSKEFGEVVAMAGEGTADELAANFAEHAASGFTGCEQVGKISADRIVNRNNFVNSKTMPVLADRDCIESD